MKNLMLILCVLILVSCKGGGEGEATSNGGRTYVTRYFTYITNFGSDSVDVIELDNRTGSTSRVETQAVGDGPMMSVVHPNGKYLYVTNSRADSISVFSIDQDTGDLDLIEEELNVGDYPHGIAIEPNGEFLYVAAESDAQLVTLSINKSNGHLDKLYTTNTGNAPHDVKVVKNFIYVSNFTSGTLSVFKFNTATGLPVSEQTVVVGTNPHRIHFNAFSTYLYVVNRGSNQVTLLSRNSNGRLNFIENTSTGNAPTSISLQGNYAFVTNWSDDTMSVYSVNSSSGRLSPLGVKSTGDKPAFVVSHPSNDMLVTLNEGDSEVQAFDRSGSSLFDAGFSLTVGSAPQHVSYLSITN